MNSSQTSQQPMFQDAKTARFQLVPPTPHLVSDSTDFLSWGFSNTRVAADAKKRVSPLVNNFTGDQGQEQCSFTMLSRMETKENSSLFCNLQGGSQETVQYWGDMTRKSVPVQYQEAQLIRGCEVNAPISSRSSLFSQVSSNECLTQTSSFNFQKLNSRDSGVQTSTNASLLLSTTSTINSNQSFTNATMQKLMKANSHQPQVPTLNTSSSQQHHALVPSQLSRSTSSNAYKCDRFIPFRGTSDNFILEEYMLNNENPYNHQKKLQDTSMSNAQGVSASPGVSVALLNQTPGQAEGVNSQPNEVERRAQSSGGGSSTQYSLGSGNKKKQSFQELVTETLFTNKRGSPNTLTLQEAEDEELRFSGLGQLGAGKGTRQENQREQKSRILQFKEKRSQPSMSLAKNISLIKTLGQDKTQKQKKNLRVIPQFPERILDAPDLVDDYYLNLLDWSPGNVLAVCLAQTVYLWNSETGEIKQLFDTQNDDDIVTSVAWMKSSSPILAIGTSSRRLHLWDAQQFQSIKTFEEQHTGRISSLSWNPSQSHLISSGSIDSLIHTNDIRAPQSQSIVCTYQYHRQEVCGLKWSPDGHQLASGGNDNLLCIWDINSRMRSNTFSNNSLVVSQPRHCFTDHKAAVKAIAWCPWQRHLLASGGGSRDQTIKFWNTDAGTLLNSVNAESQVCSLQWNPYDKEILSSHGFINNQLCIWKYPKMKKIADLRGHTSRVLHLALSPDGTTVASAAADETLRFWNVFEPNHSSFLPHKPQNLAPTLMTELSNRPDESPSQQTIPETSEFLIPECSKFYHASPSQFNGYSLR